jgi:hypothetical protein
MATIRVSVLIRTTGGSGLVAKQRLTSSTPCKVEVPRTGEAARLVFGHEPATGMVRLPPGWEPGPWPATRASCQQVSVPGGRSEPTALRQGLD